MSEISHIIDRVQKLLAMSKCSNANEAAAFAAIANRLIDQYRLSEADLETRTETSEPIEEDVSYIYESGRVNPWKVRLVGVLIDHYGLTWWNDATFTTGRKVTRYKVVGRRSDIAIAKYMFAWLTVECQRLCDLEAKGKGHIFAGSYCLGFVHGIFSQLKSSRVEVQKLASTSAIVKIDARSKEAEEFMYKLRPNLRPSISRSQVRYDGTAFAAGVSKGESMHLGVSASKLLTR